MLATHSNEAGATQEDGRVLLPLALTVPKSLLRVAATPTIANAVKMSAAVHKSGVRDVGIAEQKRINMGAYTIYRISSLYDSFKLVCAYLTVDVALVWIVSLAP